MWLKYVATRLEMYVILYKFCSDYELERYAGLLGCKAIWAWKKILFQKNRHTAPYSTLMMEAIYSSETLQSVYNSTRPYNPEVQQRYMHRIITLLSHNS
jgi:hypothetical protein